MDSLPLLLILLYAYVFDSLTIILFSAGILDMIALPSTVVGPRRAAAASSAVDDAGATTMAGGLLLAFDKHPTKVWVHALRGGSPTVLDFAPELVAVDMAERCVWWSRVLVTTCCANPSELFDASSPPNITLVH